MARQRKRRKKQAEKEEGCTLGTCLLLGLPIVVWQAAYDGEGTGLKATLAAAAVFVVIAWWTAPSTTPDEGPAERQRPSGPAGPQYVSTHLIDWTGVETKPSGVAVNGQVAMVRFTYQGSEPVAYETMFFRSGIRSWATCTCKAGKKRRVCKHRTEALSAHLHKILPLIAGTSLADNWARYQRAESAPGGAYTDEFKLARWALQDAMRPPRGFAGYGSTPS